MLKKSFLALVLVFAFCGFSFAENFSVPEQKVVVPTTPVRFGAIINPKLTPVTGTVPNLANTSVEWKVYTFGVKEDGSQVLNEEPVFKYEDGVLFGSGITDQTFFVQAIVTHLYLVKDANGVVKEAATRTPVYTAKVVVGQPAPPTPPAPPSLPDGKFGMAKTTYQLANANFTRPIAVKGAPVLAGSFREIAKQISNGKWSTVEALLNDSKTINNEALAKVGVTTNDSDKFFTALQPVVFKLYKDKKLNGLNDFVILYGEMADGLAAVK